MRLRSEQLYQKRKPNKLQFHFMTERKVSENTGIRVVSRSPANT